MYPIPKLYKLFSPLVNLSNLTLHQKHGHIFSFVKTMFLCNSFGVTQFTWNSRIKYDFRGDNFWGVLTILLKMFKSTYIVKCFVWLQSVYHNLPLSLYICIYIFLFMMYFLVKRTTFWFMFVPLNFLEYKGVLHFHDKYIL